MPAPRSNTASRPTIPSSSRIKQIVARLWQVGATLGVIDGDHEPVLLPLQRHAKPAARQFEAEWGRSRTCRHHKLCGDSGIRQRAGNPGAHVPRGGRELRVAGHSHARDTRQLRQVVAILKQARQHVPPSCQPGPRQIGQRNSRRLREQPQRPLRVANPALSTTTLFAMRAMAPNGGISNKRALRDHTITGRSGAASGSTTDGKSASAASEAVISICFAADLAPPAERHPALGVDAFGQGTLSRAAQPHHNRAGRMLRHQGRNGFPNAAASPLASASTTRVKVQARNTPAPPSAPSETHRSASSRRTCSGATITVSSTRARGAPASSSAAAGPQDPAA